jgi:histidinol-phosphate aminotransferase
MMSNESPFAPSQRVLDAIISAAMKGNIYPTGAGELRGKLGRRESLDGDHVLLGAGSTELIDLVIRTFVAPGEETLISVPTFSMYEARTRTVGGIPVLVPMTSEPEVDLNEGSSAADFDVPAIIGAVTERTKVIFLCTPNNPTGNRVQEAALRRVLRLGLPTVVDEAYYELGETPESLAYLLSEFPNAIFLRTFSKAFGLAGLRVGYLIAHPAVVRLLARVKLPWNVSTITIAAASAALDDIGEQEQRLRHLRDGRAYLTYELAKLPGVTVFPSEGNFVLIDVGGSHLSADGVVDAMLDRGIFVRKLGVHHAGRTMVRITVGTADQNARCLHSMRQVLAPAPELGDYPTADAE